MPSAWKKCSFSHLKVIWAITDLSYKKGKTFYLWAITIAFLFHWLVICTFSEAPPWGINFCMCKLAPPWATISKSKDKCLTNARGGGGGWGQLGQLGQWGQLALKCFTLQAVVMNIFWNCTSWLPCIWLISAGFIGAASICSDTELGPNLSVFAFSNLDKKMFQKIYLIQIYWFIVKLNQNNE